MHELFFGGRYSELTGYYNKISDYCIQKCNIIQIEIMLQNYNLSKQELYEKAIPDFQYMFEKEDKARRKEFYSNQDYQQELLKRYSSIEEVEAYFDRLKEYDIFELSEIKAELSSYINRKIPQQKIKLDEVDKIFEDAFMNSQFTNQSNAQVGGLYKVLKYKITPTLAEILGKRNLIQNQLEFSYQKNIENPSFYIDDRLFASISTHEKTIVLFLTDTELEEFRKMNIPYA